MCAVRIVAFVMIEVSYWNGLQMLQYSSVALAPICSVVELIRIRHIVVPLVAIIFPGNVCWREVRLRYSARTREEW